MKKKYYDQEKANYIHGKLKSTNIDEVWYPIISDIMLRRQFEFGLTDELLERDINTFIGNVDRIRTKKTREGQGGGFNQLNKTLIISSKLLSKENVDYEMIYDVFAHEVTHAISFENFDNGHEKHTPKLDRTFPSLEKIGIMELFTECRADSISNNSRPTQSSFRYQSNYNRYFLL